VPSQVAPALAGGTHGRQLAPHEPVLVLLAQAPPQRWVPVTQLKSQPPPLHTGTPLGGGTQSAHAVPHCMTLLAGTHAPPHLLKPTLQTKSHVPALHVAVAPGGAAQGAQREPQVRGESLLAQTPVHA